MPFAQWPGIWQPTTRPPAGNAEGTVQSMSTRCPDPTTIRNPPTDGSTLTFGVAPGGNPTAAAASALSHALWAASSPMTASWTSSPPLTTWSSTVSPATTSTTDGWNVQSRAMMLTSRGAAEVPGEIGGVGGAAPASQAATTTATAAAIAARTTARAVGECTAGV